MAHGTHPCAWWSQCIDKHVKNWHTARAFASEASMLRRNCTRKALRTLNSHTYFSCTAHRSVISSHALVRSWMSHLCWTWKRSSGRVPKHPNWSKSESNTLLSLVCWMKRVQVSGFLRCSYNNSALLCVAVNCLFAIF